MLKNWFNQLLYSLGGHFLEDYPQDEVEIHKWQGFGEKKNVKLKSQKIQQLIEWVFGITVQVQDNQIGLLRFQIPWNKIWKEPTRITIKDAYINAKTTQEFSAEFMNDRMHRMKMNQVEKEIKKVNNQFQRKPSGLLRSIKNFFSEMIVIEIENFHINLEDEDTCLKHQKFQLGLTVKRLTLTPTFNQKDPKVKIRILEFNVTELSAYLRVESQKSEQMSQNQLIEPINLNVKISTIISEEQQEQVPLRKIEITMIDNFKVNIDNQQFHALMRLLRLKKWHCQLGNHLKYRPNFNCRPQQNRELWIEYFRNIVKHLIETQKQNRQLFKRVDELRIRRQEYVNLILIDLFHTEKQDKVKLQLEGQVIDLTMNEISVKKQEYERKMRKEEIVFACQTANRIMNDQKLLMDKLTILNLDVIQNQEQRRFWFWRKSESGTEFNELYEKFKAINKENPNQILKQFNIEMKSIQINLRTVIDRTSNTFLKIDFQEIKSQINTKHHSFNINYSIQDIWGLDVMNSNKDNSIVFQYHQYIHRSKIMQHQFRDRALFELYYEKQTNKQENKKKKDYLTINILPILISLNDTVILRLYPFLNQLTKTDYFYKVVQFKEFLGFTKLNQQLSTMEQQILTASLIDSDSLKYLFCYPEQKLFKLQDMVIKLFVENITVRLPESALRTNCPMLQLTIQSYKFDMDQEISQQIEKLSVTFNYSVQNKIESIVLLEPVTLQQQILINLQDNVSIQIKNSISDILVRIPILNTNFFTNFIYNLMGTMESMQQLIHFEENDIQLPSQSLKRKRSHSFSLQRDQSSISRRDDTSSQNESEIFYDAEEYLFLQQMQSIQQTQFLSPLEKREQLLKKWQKLKSNLNYIISGLFKDVDPYLLEFFKKLYINIQTQIPQITLQLIKNKKKCRISKLVIINLRNQILKEGQQERFEFNLSVDKLQGSIYKLTNIEKLFKFDKQHVDILDINYDMLNLLPILLRLKSISINYRIKINKISLDFQQRTQSDESYLSILINNFSILSQEPFKLFYKAKFEDKPFFLELKNRQVAQWNTKCICTFGLSVLFLNDNHFIEESQFEIIYNNDSVEQVFNISTKQFFIQISPKLIFALNELNKHSIQFKQLLIAPLSESLDKVTPKGCPYKPIMLENEDATIYIQQLELQHTYHYRAKYFVSITEVQQRISFKQLDNFQKKQSYPFDTIQESSRENISERESLKQMEPRTKPTQYLYVNLTGQKLMFIVNGIEYKVASQDFKYINCKEQVKFQFCPNFHHFHKSCTITTNHPGVFLIRIFPLFEKQNSSSILYYILTISQHENKGIYQIEQLPKAPYLIKNKCSQIIVISQEKNQQFQQIIDPGNSEMFCWDNPFEAVTLQLQMHSDGQIKQFMIDIDGFNNEEILIDKNLYQDIDREYTLEIFNDGIQKVIVITEKEALKQKKKTIQLNIGLFGVSLVNKEELMFMSSQNLMAQIINQNDTIRYTIEFENGQMDNQSIFLPKRQLFIQNQQTKWKLFNNGHDQIEKMGLFRLQCKQKATSEILVHFQYIKLKFPNYKLVIDGLLMRKLIEFIEETKGLVNKQKSKRQEKSFERLNTSSNEILNKSVHPKKIHIDRIQIKPFTFRLKFRNLMLIEQALQTLHHLAGLAAFFLTQLKALYFEFPLYQKKDHLQVMYGNYESQLKEVGEYFASHLNNQLHQQINASNILKNQGNLSKQINIELKKFIEEINEENQDFAGWTFKFQVLQTGFSMIQSVFSAFDSTLETVLFGVQKYFEAQNVNQTTNQQQQQQKVSFSHKISQLFTKVSSSMSKSFMPHNNMNIQQFQQIIQNLKIRRLPLFTYTHSLTYDENLSKLYIYRKWKQPDIDNQFVYYALKPNIYLFISKNLFTILDTQANQIKLEIQTIEFYSIQNVQNECQIKYKVDDEDVGMNQFKIIRYSLSFNIEESLLNRIIQQVQIEIDNLKRTNSQIYSFMMF